MSTQSGPTVLVADDDADVRAMIVDYLRARGCTVSEAADGFEALTQMKRARPSAVVLDLVMPRLGGLEALRQIRASAPQTPVVVVTGAGDPRLTEDALAAGAAGVLHKPLDLPRLHALISAPAPPAKAVAPAGGRAQRAAGAGDAGRVLIVDDDPEVCTILAEFLAAHGYATRSAADAAGAFWAFTQEVPDVVLLDIAMPGLSGVDIIPAIRFANRDVKVIMVSGVTDADLAKRALAQGAFDYVTKPVDMDYLLRSVATAMALKQLDAE